MAQLHTNLKELGHKCYSNINKILLIRFIGYQKDS
jgi:hypothetical protein